MSISCLLGRRAGWCRDSARPPSRAPARSGRIWRAPPALSRNVTEVLFYHLDRQPLERVLPDLLERCLERGWRAVVQVGSEERRDALDAHLWTYREEGFLPHGTVKDGSAEAQ